MQPAGILFDFDGVIVDSLSLHLTAWDQTNQKFFGQPLASHLMKSLMGRSTMAIARLLTEQAGQPEKAAEFAEQKRDFLRASQKPVELIAGVRELFDELRSQNKPFGIASNAPREFIGSNLKALQLTVPVYLGVEDYPRAKPAPDPYLLCAKKVGIGVGDHRYTYVLEDSTHGLKAAIDAKMIAIGVTTQHDEATLRAAGAHLICRDLVDFMNKGWLDQIPIVS